MYISKNSPGFKKIERNYDKKTNGKHGGINLPNFQKNCGRTSRRNLNLEIQPRLRVRSTKALKESNRLMHGCGNRWQLHRILPVPKRFLRAGRHPHNFSKKIDQTLENKHPAWLEDIIVVTKCSKQKHMEELIDVLTKLQNAGYRLSESKSELFKTEIDWIGHKIDQNGIRPL